MSEREKFEKWFKENSFRAIGSRDYCLQWDAWQAALSTRKAYGYGIVDKDGKPLPPLVYRTENEAKDATSRHKWMYPEAKVTPLFYEDQS